MTEPTLVSACLLGARCRYDGRTKMAALPMSGPILPGCPEVMAGFGVPRPAIERTNKGRIRLVKSREDVTEQLTTACRTLVNRAISSGVRHAVLKERSPSCGSSEVWCDGDVVPGEGLLTEMLRAAGIRVTNELGASE